MQLFKEQQQQQWTTICMWLYPPPLQGYWSLGVTDCIGKPSSASHGPCEVGEASCLSVTDGSMSALPASLAWWAVKPALSTSCPSEYSRSVRATESAVVISQWAVVLAWIRRPCLSQNPNHFKNLFRRSSLMHLSGTSHGKWLFCSSHCDTAYHIYNSTTGASGHALQNKTIMVQRYTIQRRDVLLWSNTPLIGNKKKQKN